MGKVKVDLATQFQAADRFVNETVKGIKTLMDGRYITALYAVLRLHHFSSGLISLAKEKEEDRVKIEALDATIRGISSEGIKNSFAIYGADGIVDVYVSCHLDSLANVNELIDKLVKAKNEAFPSGGEEHKRRMEELVEAQGQR
jgi:hypothetical protein